jgi:hypothetical protein
MDVSVNYVGYDRRLTVVKQLLQSHNLEVSSTNTTFHVVVLTTLSHLDPVAIQHLASSL